MLSISIKQHAFLNFSKRAKISLAKEYIEQWQKTKDFILYELNQSMDAYLIPFGIVN